MPMESSSLLLKLTEAEWWLRICRSSVILGYRDVHRGVAVQGVNSCVVVTVLMVSHQMPNIASLDPLLYASQGHVLDT
jgi:hypothetical protein